ncbi:zinc ABC transporter substrate-binding protein [Ruficoccus amylovorans]|uniref:Zinc ABC transporter substrate-binding protein n=1 Tax=Ruficoccus amylovorans TaxID=1804625 RepID=A0A842HGA4_9BACT|nr:metal ABC transporter substrate-binding protein [Ruficoccus amylovorans]MBC2594281.1 zinc ABC transporter substrate-binding protein [Ruficoccus amylovorans]
MSLRKKIIALLIGVLATPLLHATQPHVVASFGIPADWVRQIAGDKVELTVLADKGQDIHAFEPAPRDLAKLSQADLVVQIGPNLEFWLDDLLASSRFQGQRLSLSNGLTLRKADDYHGDKQSDHSDSHDGHSHDGHDHDSHAGHDHGDYDPHVWMDPENVSRMSAALTEALCQIDPDNASTYRDNAKRWNDKLLALDQQARERFAAIPEQARVIITYHDNLGYFADRYGIEIPATILGSVSTEGGEPSARQMAALIKLIRQDQVAAIFTDPGANDRLARQLCRETGLPAPRLLYVGTFSRDTSGPQDYESLFLYTVDTIADSIQAKNN